MKRFNNVPTTSNTITVPLKYLVVVVASMMVMPVAQADVAGKKIGDLEIYKAAEGGKTTITMMLDTSGSMTLNQVNSAVTCDLPSGTSYTKGFENSTTTPVYRRDYCLTASGKVYDRLTRLKDAIFTLLDSSLLDRNKVSIGIGQYSSQSGSDNVVITSSNGTARDADGSTGKILVPAALVDATQIGKIKKAVAEARGGNGTPTANAYAEVAAYMLGTNTSASSYSGYNKSVSDSKSGGRYNSPLSSPSSCDGRGIYFLTDGEPNSSPNPNHVMQLALGASSFSIPSVTLPSGSQSGNGMPQVGAFAKALRDPTINPLGTNREIFTAVVGFGSVFDVDRVADARKPL